MRRLSQRFGQLSRPARGFVVRAWLAAPLVELALEHLGLAATLDWVSKLPRRRATHAPHGGSVDIAEGRGLVDAAYRHHFVHGTCLPRAVLQYALHRRDGVQAELRIGVRREGDPPSSGEAPSLGEPPKPPPQALAAHAWVSAVAETAVEPFEAILTCRSSG